MATHYDTLGVATTATSQELRQAYLRRARALHPDRQLDREPAEARKAEQAMQQVNAAWTVLSDVTKKAAYDHSLKPNPRPAQARPQQRAPQPAPRQVQQQRPAAATHSLGRAIDDEPGDGSVSVWASIPVLILLGILLGIVIIAAFAGGEPTDNRPVVPIAENELKVGDCFELIANVPRQRSCDTGAATGQVVGIGVDSGNCPANAQSIKDPTSDLFLCWAALIPGSSITVP